MTTKRPGRGDQFNSVQEMKGPPLQDSQTKIKHERQDRKRQILADQRNRYDTLRWVLIALFLIIAAIGLFYYFNLYIMDISNPHTLIKNSQPVKKSKPSETKASKKTSSGKPTKRAPKSPAPPSSTLHQKQPDKQTEESKKKPRLLQKSFAPDDPDKPYLIEILHADNLLEAGEYTLALQSFNDILKKFPQSPRGLYGKAITLSKMSEQKKSNKLMDTAIDFYKKAGLESFIGDVDFRVAALVELADRAYDRGKGGLSIKALEKLVSLKEDNDLFSNRLGLGYIADGKLKKAKTHFKSHLKKFPEDHFANAQLGYVLYSEKRYEQALPLLLHGIRNDKGVKVNPKFYLYAGESLTKLNRSEESYILYSEAVNLKLFPSIWQRPLFSQPNLRASGWWNAKDTGYVHDIQRLEKTLGTIKEEVKTIFDSVTFSFTNGTTNSQRFILFMNGKKNSKNCQKAPKTCALIESFPEAAHCRRGSVRFTFIPPKSHISAFVGLTNTKLQIIAVLDMGSNEEGITLRVAEEKKVIKAGQLVILDESFEQEIWNPGNEAVLFLLVDVWHPDLTDLQMRQLGPIY